jgi:CRISPR system Cascade subunit CasC
MFIELHILQNFAPSNLNRSDTGAPKDCEFGGHRRARISSQCLKRAIRRDAGFNKHLAEYGGGRRKR